MHLSPEQVIQAQCCDFTKKFCPEIILSSSQNGIYLGQGNYRFQYMEKMKKLGMLPGECDIMLTWPQKNILFVEVKQGDNDTTNNQKEVIKQRKNQGFDCEVIWTLIEYYEALKKYHAPMNKGFYAGIGWI